MEWVILGLWFIGAHMMFVICCDHMDVNHNNTSKIAAYMVAWPIGFLIFCFIKNREINKEQSE